MANYKFFFFGGGGVLLVSTMCMGTELQAIISCRNTVKSVNIRHFGIVM